MLFLVLLEFLLYITRNILLKLRLFANILKDHMLLNILSRFAYNILLSGFIYIFIGLISLIFIIVFSGLQLNIVFIQSQVIEVLTGVILKNPLIFIIYITIKNTLFYFIIISLYIIIYKF